MIKDHVSLQEGQLLLGTQWSRIYITSKWDILILVVVCKTTDYSIPVEEWKLWQSKVWSYHIEVKSHMSLIG